MKDHHRALPVFAVLSWALGPLAATLALWMWSSAPQPDSMSPALGSWEGLVQFDWMLLGGSLGSVLGLLSSAIALLRKERWAFLWTTSSFPNALGVALGGYLILRPFW